MRNDESMAAKSTVSRVLVIAVLEPGRIKSKHPVQLLTYRSAILLQPRNRMLFQSYTVAMGIWQDDMNSWPETSHLRALANS